LVMWKVASDILVVLLVGFFCGGEVSDLVIKKFGKNSGVQARTYGKSCWCWSKGVLGIVNVSVDELDRC
jgi:hypothetical protein